MNPDIRVATIGKRDAVFYGDVTCGNQIAHFEWDKNTDGLRLFQNTRFLKREVPPAEEFFIHKEAITDAIVLAVDEYIEAQHAATLKSLDQLITEAGGSVAESYKPISGEPIK